MLKNELEDLVERRNEVAHRAIPDEILSYDHLLAKVAYVEAISLALISTLAHLLIRASVGNGGCVELGVAAERLKNGRVVVFSSLSVSVSEGDDIVAIGSSSARWGRIKELRVSDAPVSKASAGDEAGFLLDFAVPRNATIHIWKSPISGLVSPPAGIFGGNGPFEVS